MIEDTGRPTDIKKIEHGQHIDYIYSPKLISYFFRLIHVFNVKICLQKDWHII